MDRVLLESLIAESGNWSAVARLLRDSDGSGPSALECVARVIYLPSTSPSTLKSAVGSSASKAAIRSAHLSYEIAYEMGAALGCKAAQAVVLQVLGSLAEVQALIKMICLQLLSIIPFRFTCVHMSVCLPACLSVCTSLHYETDP